MYLFYSLLSRAVLLMLLIRLIYMFTYTLLRMIIVTEHLVKPELHKHFIIKMAQMFKQAIFRSDIWLHH